jgi:peptidoglycan hydrolase-like protein with peptidoglycan-binding domain
MARRRRLLLVVVAGAVVVAAGGVGAASLIKSPAQVAAETAPPAPDTLTALVQHRVLAMSLITRGKVTTSQTMDVAGEGAGGQGAARTVVTKVKVKAGDRVPLGTVLVEVSGRPIFTLKGALPAYRDLHQGLRGDDVAQLQQALAALGHGRGRDRQGYFGAGTQAAVGAFYKSIGYEPAPGAGQSPPADLPNKSTEGEKRGKLSQQHGEGGPGVSVPAGEVVYLNARSAKAESVTAKVGSAPGDKLLTLSAGETVVEGTVALHEKDLVRTGQKVQILSEVTGKTARGTVTSVSEVPATQRKGEEQSADRYTVHIRPDRSLPREFSGQDVRLTITAASSEGKVLVVPSSAISTGADGRTTVSVQDAPGKQRRVEVRTGMSGDGYVEVTARGDGQLRAGSSVIVGTDVRPAAKEPR